MPAPCRRWIRRQPISAAPSPAIRSSTCRRSTATCSNSPHWRQACSATIRSPPAATRTTCPPSRTAASRPARAFSQKVSSLRRWRAMAAQNNTSLYVIDGIPTASASWAGSTVIIPQEDSVQNMKVTANAYDAEFGRFSGAVIQVTSNTGTNAYHGSLFFKADRPGPECVAALEWPQLGRPCQCQQVAGQPRSCQRPAALQSVRRQCRRADPPQQTLRLLCLRDATQRHVYHGQRVV